MFRVFGKAKEFKQFHRILWEGSILTFLVCLLVEKGNGLKFSLPRLPTLPQSPSIELTAEEQKQPHIAGFQGMRVCEVCLISAPIKDVPQTIGPVCEHVNAYCKNCIFASLNAQFNYHPLHCLTVACRHCRIALSFSISSEFAKHPVLCSWVTSFLDLCFQTEADWGWMYTDEALK